MKIPYKTMITLYAALVILMAAPAFAERGGSQIPFGGYRKNGRCGYYGIRTVIETAEEARKIIEEFLVGGDLRISSMEEKPRFFKAELVDKNGAVRDVVIVNKVNGRVRSIY